ncbi:DUF6074 family protein [Martelella limonii]|uniref:DUF6074 family protein n=1 Tax=Martelella limonii TaxID=1647649 RepID=UPI00157FF57B|nr:DUF6074 family protein [Martelella limonii]
MEHQKETELPLFAWTPPKKLMVFPLVYRIGKIRDVATKMLDKPTEKSARHYRRQVDEGLTAQLERFGFGDGEIGQQLDLFWQAVEQEMHRQSYEWTNNPGDAV